MFRTPCFLRSIVGKLEPPSASLFLLFSCQVVSDSLWPHGLQHTGFPILHYLPEFAQTHVCWVSDAIQTSHPLSPPSSPAFSFSQYQGLFQWVCSSHQVVYRPEKEAGSKEDILIGKETKHFSRKTEVEVSSFRYLRALRFLGYNFTSRVCAQCPMKTDWGWWRGAATDEGASDRKPNLAWEAPVASPWCCSSRREISQ